MAVTFQNFTYLSGPPLTKEAVYISGVPVTHGGGLITVNIPLLNQGNLKSVHLSLLQAANTPFLFVAIQNQDGTTPVYGQSLINKPIQIVVWNYDPAVDETNARMILTIES